MRARIVLVAVCCTVTAGGCGAGSTGSSMPPMQQVRATFTTFQAALRAHDVARVCSILLGVSGSPVGKTIAPPSPALLAAEQRGCVRNNGGQRNPFAPFQRTIQGERAGKTTINGDRAQLQLIPRPVTLAMFRVRGAWHLLVALP